MWSDMSAMWSEFYVASLIFVLILLVPGYLALRAIGMGRQASLCCSPLVSVALISILGQAYAFAGIASSPLSLFLPLSLVLMAALLTLRGRVHAFARPQSSPWIPLAFLIVGIAMSYNLFVSRLHEPNELFQAYDLTQHLNTIRAMADSGRFSSIGVSPYLTAADQAIAPVDYTTFYPSAWHVICALVVQACGISAPAIINVSMFVFTGIVFPLAMCAFMRLIFPDERRVVLFGALVTVSFVAFPWLTLTFGPIWPNIAGFAAMPAAMTLFVYMTHPETTRSGRVRLAAALLFTIAGMALLHPNTIFTCVVILAPYCVSHIWNARSLEGQMTLRRFVVCSAFVIFCLVVWLVCYRLPFLQDIVTHQWNSFARPWQEIINILTQTYTIGFYAEVAAQLLLGVLVIIGAIHALFTPGRRWMAFSYGLACLICFMGATRNDELQHLFAGFWYTDPIRLGAMASIAAMPLAAMGLDWAYETVLGLVRRYNDSRARTTHPALIAAVIAGGFFFVNFMPEFNLPGLHYQYTESDVAFNKRVRDSRDWVKSVHTTFGDYRDVIEDVYAYDAPLDSGEWIFLNNVKEIVGDELVLNDPMDGSFLAYGYNGLRVYERNFLGFDTDRETEQSRIIRTGLSQIATNDEVREAVEQLGARYVIVMRQDESVSSLINQRGDYKPELFSGISSIDLDTPGFTCVYRWGTMCLYEIDAAA